MTCLFLLRFAEAPFRDVVDQVSMWLLCQLSCMLRCTLCVVLEVTLCFVSDSNVKIILGKPRKPLFGFRFKTR